MLVSVLINNYNYSQYLDSCLKSVLNQTYENVEVIVYDDGSTDSSIEVLEKYKQQVTVINNRNYKKSTNQNQANAIYQAFLKSKGDIICLLDSDDSFFYNKIETIVHTFEENDHACTVQHLLQEIDSEDRVLNAIRPVLKNVEDIKAYIYNNQNLSHLFVPTSGLSFKRSFLEKYLPLKEDDFTYLWPDTRLMLNSIFYGEVISIRQALAYYRLHGTNDSSVRGSFEGHNLYLKQLYQYFNEIAHNHGFSSIQFDKHTFLKNTFFYSSIDQPNVISFSKTVGEPNELYIWGAGEAGQSIAITLAEHNIPFMGFIDSDSRKQDQIILGKKVLNPETMLFSQNSSILVSPYHAYDQIKSGLESNNLIEGVNFIDPYRR